MTIDLAKEDMAELAERESVAASAPPPRTSRNFATP
jgi:hypothetical protein